MKEWHISEADWFDLPRDERARKVGYIVAHAALENMMHHDARKEAEDKAKSKAKKR